MSDPPRSVSYAYPLISLRSAKAVLPRWPSAHFPVVLTGVEVEAPPRAESVESSRGCEVSTEVVELAWL